MPSARGALGAVPGPGHERWGSHEVLPCSSCSRWPPRMRSPSQGTQMPEAASRDERDTPNVASRRVEHPTGVEGTGAQTRDSRRMNSDNLTPGGSSRRTERFHLRETSRNGKSLETERGAVVARSWGRGGSDRETGVGRIHLSQGRKRGWSQLNRENTPPHLPFCSARAPCRSEAPACAAEGISSLRSPDSHAHLSPRHPPGHLPKQSCTARLGLLWFSHVDA